MGILDENKKIKRISAGIVVLRNENQQWYALVLRAWSHWDFPKGSVEHGETLMQAAIREVKEETGITQLEFHWGSSLARTNIYSKDKVAYYAIAQTLNPEVQILPNPQTGLKEHDEYQWCPWENLGHLLSPRLHPILNWVSARTGLPVLDFNLINSESLATEKNTSTHVSLLSQMSNIETKSSCAPSPSSTPNSNAKTKLINKNKRSKLYRKKKR